MKRTELRRKTRLVAKKAMKRGGSLTTKTQLKRTTMLRKTPLKAKRRRAKPGDEPAYKAFVKAQPCCVGGKRCGKVDPHHIINGKGVDRKGVGQTAPDRTLLALCRRHHDEFHDRRGFAKGWDDARRLVFQQDEASRLRQIWNDLNELEVLQEPDRVAV